MPPRPATARIAIPAWWTIPRRPLRIILFGSAARGTMGPDSDLDRLALGLEGIGIEIPESIDQATVLTRYAMDTRYPGGFEPVGAAEHQEAVRLAETVVAWAWTQIAPPGG